MKKSMKMLLSTAVWLTMVGGGAGSGHFRTARSDCQCR